MLPRTSEIYFIVSIISSKQEVVDYKLVFYLLWLQTGINCVQSRKGCVDFGRTLNASSRSQIKFQILASSTDTWKCCMT